MKKYVLYHANCYDGFGAALAAWLKYRDQATYIPVSYGHPPPEMEPESVVFIVDFSYDAKTLVNLSKSHELVCVLDHHATAQKDLSKDEFIAIGASVVENERGWLDISDLSIKFDMNKSGAVLAWEYFHPDETVPLFFQYLQDRDLWKFELLNSRAVSAYLQTKEMEFPLWEYLMREFDDRFALAEFIRAGAACLKLKNQMVDLMADNARWMWFHKGIVYPGPDPYATDPPLLMSTGYWAAPVANATCFFSEVGERLLELYPMAQFAAYYLDRRDGKRQWGLRSRKDFDCSVIAKAFGGGGHKQASGFVEDIKA